MSATKERMMHHEMHSPKKGFKNAALNSLREVIFGLEDGIVSTLGAITGIAAGTQDRFVVVLSGVVIIFVESLSMAAGTYLSSKSEREMEEKMLREEEKEIEMDPVGERRELVEFYEARGFSKEAVEIVVNHVTSDKKLWLEEMAFKELCIVPHKAETPKTDAFFMVISYMVGGITPLLAYFFLPIGTAMVVSIIVAVCALFMVGFIKGRLVMTSSIRSGIEMVVVSLSAAAVGYIVGQLVSNYFSL